MEINSKQLRLTEHGEGNEEHPIAFSCRAPLRIYKHPSRREIAGGRNGEDGVFVYLALFGAPLGLGFLGVYRIHRSG